MSPASIDAPALRAALTDGREIALLDLRPEGRFGHGHILLAVNLPLDRLELDLRRLVPRPATRIVLCDDDDSLALRAAAVLAAAGYHDLALLDGGVEAWAAAGYELFSGLNVPSKAFGELLEARYGTPEISAAELKALTDANADLVVLDSRPLDEFRAMCIPGGIDVPGAELVYRVRALAPDPETLVVVNCAGRTRSIVGCQSLVNAGIPNRVAALTNGTMGWHLAGFALERGAARRYPENGPEATAWARGAAAAVARRFGVRFIDAAALERFRAEREERSLYLLDVRAPEEYAAGHLADAQPAPGGQLVQATDRYLAVRQGRLVLIDNADAVRATMTASWLIQMGYPEVYVLEGGLAAAGLVSGIYRPPAPELDCLAVETLTPAELSRNLADCLVVDFARSLDFRQGHIPGAWWAARLEIEACVSALPSAARIATTSGDGALARLAAADLAPLVPVPVRALEGGTVAWRAAGLPLESGFERAASAPEDVYERPYDRGEGVEAAMRAYLAWEVGLVEQLERDGTLRFPTFPAA